MLKRLYGPHWDRLTTIEKIGEIIGAAFVFFLPILLLFYGAAFQEIVK